MILKQRPVSKSGHLATGSGAFDRVLAARGVNSASELEYRLRQLLPPAGLSNIRDAAVLLAEAVTAAAKVVIVGDFDADGATSCALAIRCLREFGLKEVSYLVPNRFEFGYGLSPEIVGVAATRHPDIIITVDNGISSVDGVYAAQQLGMSVLITDHHLPGEEIPSADVIVNPNLPGDRFASKNLAGVGVIFYVMLALRAELRSLGWFEQSGLAEPNMSQYLDLVALGTVADVVPLDANNRILVQQGLQRIRAGQGCAGINALLTVAKRDPTRMAAMDLGFAVGPRLNAAGRLDDMSLGIECLLADDEATAIRMAMQLDELNLERRALEQSMQQDAQKVIEHMQIDDSGDPVAYVLSDESWHQGIVGLVASRIKDKVNRPVIALAPGEGAEWKGSARSVEGVHIRDVLARVDSLRPGLLKKFGGHAMAAGLAIDRSNIQEFSQLLLQAAEEMTQGKDWTQVLWTDGELVDEEYSQALANQFRTCSPWGQAFPEPLFEGSFEVVEARVVGDRHAKLKLQPLGSNKQIEAICFGYLDDHADLPMGAIHAAFRLDVNEWQGRTSLQLVLQHVSSLDNQ